MLLIPEPPSLALKQDETEHLRNEIAQLKADLKTSKITNSKSQKALKDKVISEHRASDAAKAKLKLTADSSNLCVKVNQHEALQASATTLVSQR